MEPITLKVPISSWFKFFIFFFVITSLFMVLSTKVPNIYFLILLTFIGSVIVTVAAVLIFNCFQKEVIIGENTILKVGLSEKRIEYDDIKMIKVGSGGISLYDDQTSVNITTMYRGFNTARKVVLDKIKPLTGIEIKGLKRYKKKYLDM